MIVWFFFSASATATPAAGPSRLRERSRSVTRCLPASACERFVPPSAPSELSASESCVSVRFLRSASANAWPAPSPRQLRGGTRGGGEQKSGGETRGAPKRTTTGRNATTPDAPAAQAQQEDDGGSEQTRRRTHQPLRSSTVSPLLSRIAEPSSAPEPGSRTSAYALRQKYCAQDTEGPHTEGRPHVVFTPPADTQIRWEDCGGRSHPRLPCQARRMRPSPRRAAACASRAGAISTTTTAAPKVLACGPRSLSARWR